MTDLMMRGMRWLSRLQRRCLAVPVVYERAAPDGGKSLLLSIPAVMGGAGATRDISVAPMGLDADDVDFMISDADLRTAGNPVEPRADDRVYCSRDGVTHVYEVLPRGNEKPWRWSDPQRTIRRIHTRHIDDYPTPGERP